MMAAILVTALFAGRTAARAADAAAVPAEKPADLAATLETVLKQNFAASEQKDVKGVMATLHTNSPVAAVTAEALTSLFETFELKYELLSFRLVGRDGEYAVARAEQKTTKVKGPDFKDNVIDSLYIFRTQDGKWRLWYQVLLETRLAK